MSGSSSKIPGPRCSHCRSLGGQTGNTRNLIVCIDGTSNKFSRNNTNVVKLFAKIVPKANDLEQLAYYSSGIGTRPHSLNLFTRMGRAITDTFDMAVAWNMEEIIKDAYGWLARMYRPGDQIYLFGFSRGAFQVRVLAGMIHMVGLIKTPTEKQIGMAYEHCRVMHSVSPVKKQLASAFKKTFSWEGLRIHFIGVWDTVSSVGLIKQDVHLSISSTASHACHFRHALALDERRVKFMPEYFHEMNPLPANVKAKYVDAHARTWSSGTSKSTVRNDPTSSSGPTTQSSQMQKLELRESVTADIKEVWFAGCHGDVGGKSRSGNVSLLWMRREAAEKGLTLYPTDILWVPDDVDSGTTDSMSLVWEIVECLPIRHQVSFSGSGKNSRRMHLKRPRRIIPGQKVHASVLYADAYKPRATFGKGFDMPLAAKFGELDYADLSSQIWEASLFDHTAAEELVQTLNSQKVFIPICFDRLLFMLRFEEGRKCLRNVPSWKKTFEDIFDNHTSTPLLRLVALVAYYEVSCDPVAPKSSDHPRKPSQDTYNVAKKYLTDTLTESNSVNYTIISRVTVLFGFMARHDNLRNDILIHILDPFMALVDKILSRRTASRNFIPLMDALSSLLRSEYVTERAIVKLQCQEGSGSSCKTAPSEKPSTSNDGQDKDTSSPQVSMLSKMLDSIDSDWLDGESLNAALRVVLVLAQIPGVPQDACSGIQDKISSLAGKDHKLTGQLASEILLALYDSSHRQGKLDISNACRRTNLARVWVAESSLEKRPANCGDDPIRKQMLDRVFGFNAEELDDKQKELIQGLRCAIESRNTLERTTATMALLEMCKSPTIRNYLHEINLLNAFLNQVKPTCFRRDIRGRALLAAYALATCLQYDDMKESIEKDKRFVKGLVHMLRFDFFDDAVCSIEGFQIFGSIMHHSESIRENKKIIDALKSTRWCCRKPKQRRTARICLDILQCFDTEDPAKVRESVKKSLEHLQDRDWKNQKVGLTILFELSRTERGAEAIVECDIIREIFEMLLPEGQQFEKTESTPMNPTFDSDAKSQMQSTAAAAEPGGVGGQIMQSALTTTEPYEAPEAIDQNERPSDEREGTDSLSNSDARSSASEGVTTHKVAAQLMGPACALRVLAQNQNLRQEIRKSVQYASLKELHLSRMLVDREETSEWRFLTPTRSDVIMMLDKVIDTVDGRSSENFTSVWDMIPTIRHLDRFVIVLLGTVLGVPMVVICASLAFVAIAAPFSALVITGLAACLAVSVPFLLSYGIYKGLKVLWSCCRKIPLVVRFPGKRGDRSPENTKTQPTEGGRGVTEGTTQNTEQEPEDAN